MIPMPKVPRYSQFQPASPLASAIKRRNRATNTNPEVLLRRELFRLGLRYRLHDATLPGKPDLIFRRARVVVFVDGDFWHGRNWSARRTRLARGANAAYWIPKIEANIARDKKNTRTLRSLGWRVVRVWETDILRDPAAIAHLVQQRMTGRLEKR